MVAANLKHFLFHKKQFVFCPLLFVSCLYPTIAGFYFVAGMGPANNSTFTTAAGRAYTVRNPNAGMASGLYQFEATNAVGERQVKRFVLR